MHVGANTQFLDVSARWVGAHELRSGTVPVPEVVHAGDVISIWVDESGNYVDTPPPRSRAAAEGVGCGVLSWFVVAGTLAIAVRGVHRKLDRGRYVDWDRELVSLARKGADG